jgi:type IV pilus assembly protein PilN
MIRINLLGVERKQARSKGPVFDIGQKLTVGCSLILVVALLGVGYWYWSLQGASQNVDSEIAKAQQEAARLKSLLSEVQTFETRRVQLTQRVQLIEQLRGGQSVPVQVLDHVSRSLPDMLWLTAMKQDGPTLTIEGRSTTLVALSDFVGNLGNNAILQKPIEIVNSQTEASRGVANRPGQDPMEVVKFSVRAQLAGVAPKAVRGRGGRGAAR